MLGLCMRAGRISAGHDAAKQSIRSGEAKLCVISGDASERLADEMRAMMGQKPLIFTHYTMEDIGGAVGKRCGVLSVNDGNLAAKLTQIKEGLKI